ncbi:flagellar protein FlaG [Marinobacter sp. LV10MA510-1]|uniref:flagellar protein FlaG n=1 Tax=Marinobacter sp. LV10MA510-1 TaxID=1415567 RepID=UPI000BF89F02|nr:flagellar protein FlaG [Marinobacter sp. LV10MA510-1]PFG11738.1 flagellar protein FlaG [Marinobacter sp. LV10MA510-1]
MNDINLSGTGFKLLPFDSFSSSSENASSRNEGNRVSTQVGASSVDQKLHSQLLDVQKFSELEKVGAQSVERVGLLSDAVLQLNDYVQSVSRDLQFEVNSEMGQTIVRVVDQKTQEVIRQIPDEVALKLAENLLQDEPLTLFSLKV